MPSPFYKELLKRNTTLIYIGIATKSLSTRLYQQELQHQNPATFFRSLGAVLGYRPEPGSLYGKTNQNNYTFSSENTRRIIEWIDGNLEISFHYCPINSRSFESTLIKKYKPIFNLKHNPESFLLLKELRSDCRQIAKNQKLVTLFYRSTPLGISSFCSLLFRPRKPYHTVSQRIILYHNVSIFRVHNLNIP